MMSRLPWWGWVLLALGIFALGWWIGRGRIPATVVPPVSPSLERMTARADSLAGEVGRLGDSLQLIGDSLASLAARPTPAAPLPPRPPVSGDTALARYADTLEAQLAVSLAEGDTLRAGLAWAARSVQAAADTAHAATARLVGLRDTLRVLTDSVKLIEADRDQFARRAGGPRAVRFGPGGSLSAAGEGLTALAGGVLRIQTRVLFGEVELSLAGGYGIGGRTGGTLKGGPGGSLTGSWTF